VGDPADPGGRGLSRRAIAESDRASHQLVNQAILVVERNGPAEGRPLVDTITASRVANMKELRPPSAGRSEIRILLVFDPWRSAVLLVAGDKAGQARGGPIAGQRTAAALSSPLLCSCGGVGSRRFRRERTARR